MALTATFDWNRTHGFDLNAKETASSWKISLISLDSNLSRWCMLNDANYSWASLLWHIYA
jgi:hypothetical protein